MLTRRLAVWGLTGGLAGGLAGGAAFWAGAQGARAHDAHAHGAQDPAPASPAERFEVRYAAPAAPLVDHHGAAADLATELARGGPVLMNFIFTTCPGICPMLSAMLAATADALGPDLATVRLWSVSIDPDHDTPERLAAYAALYDAPPQWRFFTGAPGAVNAVRAAFDALDDVKMAHRALMLLRLRGDSWLRLEGDVTPDRLAQETRAALAGA